VRIVVASNAHLEQLVEQRMFRRDLLYRLNLLTLRLPPLRARMGDAVELANIFLARLSHQYRVPAKALHPASVEFIERYAWPGNVRELENVVHREFLMCDGAEVLLEEARCAQDPESEAPCATISFKEAKARAIADFERRFVSELLHRTDGNISRAAQLAEQDRSAFGKLARKHGLAQSAISRTASSSSAWPAAPVRETVN
jgi:DNA-binding NtrC family response regulator